MKPQSQPLAHRAALYRTLWRWHFYAGLFVIPSILILSVSGSLYLFKPQIDRWEERAFQGLPTSGAVAASAPVRAALASRPDAQFQSYRLPAAPSDAAMVSLALPKDNAVEQLFVSPRGRVIGSFDPADRFTAILVRIHGELLAAVLPMLALSLITVLLVERLVLARVPILRMWLGLRDRHQPRLECG